MFHAVGWDVRAQGRKGGEAPDPQVAGRDQRLSLERVRLPQPCNELWGHA